MPLYIQIPLNIVLFGAFWTLLAGYLPEKHPGLDWSRVVFAMGVQLIVVAIMLPITYWYNWRKMEREKYAAR